MISRTRAAALLFFIFAGLGVLSPQLAFADDGDPTSLAILPLENSSGDPRSEYLGKIAEALLSFDLSSAGKIEIVSRSDLDAVLQEKRLALSGLLNEEAELREVGGLSGADFLLRGEYVHLGDDILFIIRLISVETGEVTVYRRRGTDENTIHAIAGEVAGDLSGNEISFITEEGSRSIISMKNEEPGSLAVFSPLIDAEIFVDEEFVGYTTGRPTEAFIVDTLRPGRHRVRTHLSKNFGVIDLPEITFRDWETQVLVRPGRQSVVRDESRHFNDFLYRMQWILREDADFASSDELAAFRAEYPFEFTDRAGELRRGVLKAGAESGSPLGTRLRFDLQFDGAEETLRLDVPEEPGSENEETVLGLVELELKLEYRYNRYELDISAARTDVYQGMHREEYR